MRPLPDGTGGSFSIPRSQFSSLVRRLEPFRKQHVSAKELHDFAVGLNACPLGTPFTYDAGAIWIHWRGPNEDENYFAELGCDPKRNAARNRELLNIFESLPVPHR